MRSQVTIGISSVQPRAGCTHTCIMMANFLRAKGYKVALVEINDSGAFEEIRAASNSKLSLTKFFRYNDIDYYPYINKSILKNLSNKEYQFVIIDFGYYKFSHKPAFCHCDASIFIAGTKSWEINHLNTVFDDIEQESLNNYYYYFTFASNNEQIKNDIYSGMDYAKSHIFFPPYVENPFTQGCFPGLKTIITDVLAKETQSNQKKALFSRQNELLDISDTLYTLIDEKSPGRANRGLQDYSEDEYENVSTSKQVPKITEIEKDYEEDEYVKEPIEKNNDSLLIDDSIFNHAGFKDIDDDKNEQSQSAVIKNGYEQRSREIEQNAKNNFRDILTNDDISVQKTMGFDIHNFEKDSNTLKDLFKKFEYTKTQVIDIVSTSRECMRKTKFADIENKELILKLANDVLNDAFCMTIRSGMECKESISQKTGAPILSVTINEKDIFCGKEDIKLIFGNEFSKIPLIKESEV